MAWGLAGNSREAYGRSPREPDVVLSMKVCFGSTLYDVNNPITICLDPPLEKLLDRLCRLTGRTRSDLIREALRCHLSLLRFEQLRRQVLSLAEARGYLTDEDVTRDIS